MARSARFAGLCASVFVALGPLAPAVAQEGAPTTTVPGEDPPITAPPITAPPITGPPPVAPPVEDPAAGGDAPTGEVPEVDFTVPERQDVDGVSRAVHRAVHRNLSVSRLRLRHAEEVLDVVVARIADLDARVVELEAGVDSLRVEHRQAIRRLQVARDRLAERAASAYVRGGNLESLASVLESDDANEVGARTSMVRSVLDADDIAVDEYLAAREALTERLRATADLLFETRRQLVEAESSVDAVVSVVVDARLEFAAFEAGSEIAITGFRFPVAEPHLFTDSFGAARMTGTSFAHAHQGTDIFAPHGTRVLSVERGVITRVGTDVLGGIKLWLLGESGTHYYYAHLSGYAPELSEGLVVGPGELVGFVGDTGNAAGTPPHLHFEIHPDGGAAVNPYPLLATTDEFEHIASLP